MMKIGIIGLGIISKGHAEAFIRLDGVELIAAADIDNAKCDTFREKYDVQTFTDYKEMVDAAGIDTAVIALPHGLHREAAVYCAQRGIHIFLEKPMANTVAECDDIIEAVNKYGVKLMVGHIQRYMEANVKAHELIYSGKYGKLVNICEIRNQPYFIERRPKWFTDKKLAGGGILMNFGVHSLDRMMWIADSNIKKISGSCAQYIDGIEVEGNAQMIVEFANGISGAVNFCGYNVPITNETNYYLTEGAVKVVNGKDVYASTGGEYEFVPVCGSNNRFVNMWKDFLAHIKNDVLMPVGGEYGREIIRNIEKIYDGA